MKQESSFLSKVIIGAIALFLLLPVLVTIINSLFRDFSSLVPKGFTLEFYQSVLGGKENMLPAIGRSLMISIVPTLVMLVVLLLTLYVIQVYYPQWDKYLDILSKIPYGIQGVILAVSIISLYASRPGFLSNRIFLLGCAYSIVILPYMYQGIKNALTTIEMKPILEAAETLGSSKLYAYFMIIVPSILKGLAATLLLSIGILFSDFVLVNIIAGSYFETTGIFLDRIRSVSGHAASAISVIIFCMMLSLTFIANYLNQDSKGPVEAKLFQKENKQHGR